MNKALGLAEASNSAYIAQGAKSMLISADSHVVEPPDLWLDRLPSSSKNMAPHYKITEAGAVFVIASLGEFPIGLFCAAGRPATELSMLGTDLDELYEGALNPRSRIEDQSRDGVTGEVIYPTASMLLYSLADSSLLDACLSAYNDWLSDYCSFDKDRLYGIAALPIGNIRESVRILEGAEKAGFVGALIPPIAYGDSQYSDEMYNPIWETASSLALPISFHAGSSKTAGVDDKPMTRRMGTKSDMANSMRVVHMAQNLLAEMIFGGVFEKYPELQIVSAENDAGWVPHFADKLDRTYTRHRFWMTTQLRSALPSEILKRNVSFTMMNDRAACAHGRDFRVMWGNDYPHSESTWPDSVDTLATLFEGCDREWQLSVCWRFADDLYGLRVEQ